MKIDQPHSELPIQEEHHTEAKHIQFEENEFEDETKDEEENEPTMSQGSKQLMECVNALLQEKTNW